MFTILYEVILHILALLYFPFFIFQVVVHKKYRTNCFLRLGIGFPKIKKGKGMLFWIHAVFGRGDFSRL